MLFLVAFFDIKSYRTLNINDLYLHGY